MKVERGKSIGRTIFRRSMIYLISNNYHKIAYCVFVDMRFIITRYNKPFWLKR